MNAYPMYEKCVEHQQGYVPPLSEATEPSYINGMLMLENGERTVAIMGIKYVTDDMMEDIKRKLDAHAPTVDEITAVMCVTLTPTEHGGVFIERA